MIEQQRRFHTILPRNSSAFHHSITVRALSLLRTCVVRTENPRRDYRNILAWGSLIASLTFALGLGNTRERIGIVLADAERASSCSNLAALQMPRASSGS